MRARTDEEKKPKPLNDLRHPQYVLNQENWEKWRLTYLGGNRFIKRYLKKSSRREDDNDFIERVAISYCPAFAKAAINDVKNSIFQRICDVTRDGGPRTYQDAMDGVDARGVDLLGSSMNAFIGRDILPELLTMARVGIYVDMPALTGPTVADKGKKRPYLYWYKAEDIRSWATNNPNTINSDPTEFTAILLRDSTYDIDAHWVLPYETTTRYRYLWIDPSDGYVRCQFYNEDGDAYSPAPGNDIVWQGEEDQEDGGQSGIIKLPIKKIPFVMLELSDSLLADVADYQISLLNMASNDVAFSIKANYPFYTEQRDWRTASPHLKQAGTAPGLPGQKLTTETFWNAQTNNVIVNQDQSPEIRVGVSQGRQYALGTERPGFIHPSPEPLMASMEKQEQLKREIRQLINLAVTSLSPKMASAASKDKDNQGLEAGLSYIGLELQHAERKIAYYWAMYEGTDKPATVKYPENYSILDDTDRREQADALTKLLPHLASLTAQREVAKRLARIILGTTVKHDTLKKIDTEIDGAPVIIGDPKVIDLDVKNGLVSLETASKARGYPEGEVPKAKADHAERLAIIATSQAAGQGTGAAAGGQARGVPDLGADGNAGKKEKAAAADTTLDPVPTDKTRGEGK